MIISDLRQTRQQWQDAWPEALRLWSPYVQLHEPVWCMTNGAAKQQGLVGSFAMIRLVDHSVVINLHEVDQLGINNFAREVLAHEIGHHVLCPADLSDNARLLARIRVGLPGVENLAPMISNLYSDLLINDRLQRSEGLDISGVYRQIMSPSKSKLWLLYMRIYELLWRMSPQTLAIGSYDARLNQDAQLGARLIRSYARDWLGGGGRFACLCFPYAQEEQEEFQKQFKAWCDAMSAGEGGFPDGLSEEDEDESIGAIHPAEDPFLSGIEDGPVGTGGGRVKSRDSGVKSEKQSRGPFEYTQILQASGVKLSERELAARFYRERAIRHLIPFPSRPSRQSTDTIPEGLDAWEASEPLEEIDWWSTLLSSPDVVVPGITTRKRIVGDSPGQEPNRLPIDLYLGVDCSGSMRDPALNLSYPILAGTIMVLSALRAGARVKVVLSGEPGRSISTDGFIRDEQECLKVLTNYLGTGYAFGIHRLAETFGPDYKSERPVHVLIVSDADMFMMLNSEGDGRMGWDVARETIPRCMGGATYVLQVSLAAYPLDDPNRLGRMRADGWNIHPVSSMEELIDFARQFSRTQYCR